MKRLVAVKKPEPVKKDAPYKSLVMDAWDRLFGPEERQQKREQIWAAEDVHRKAKSRL